MDWHHANDCQTQPARQQLNPPTSEEKSRCGETGSDNSSGGRTPSEDSPPSAQEQRRSGCAQESPIRGLIIPEHPADSQAIAENMERVLCEDSALCGGDSRRWSFPLGVSGPDSLSDRGTRLQSQPLDDICDSASSSGFPGEASAGCAPESEQGAEEAGNAATHADLLPTVTSSGAARFHEACDGDRACQDIASGPEGSGSCLPDSAEVADTGGRASTAHDSDGHGSCSAASEPLSQVLGPSREPAAALQVQAAMKWNSAARLIPRLGVTAAHKLLGGGVVLIALVTALQRRSGILQLLRSVLRAFAIYRDTMQRLQ